MDRYNVNEAERIINLDQSGMSFNIKLGRSLRRGFVNGNEKKKELTLQKTLETKGNLDRVTIMPVVSASGFAFKPCVIYPGKLPHYRKVNNTVETLKDVLMPNYFYYNDSSAANSNILLDSAKNFVEETTEIRRGGKKMILILHGYGGHIQFKFFNLLKENGIIVIAMPAHTSHVFQPLDVSVFGVYKSFLQEELHRVARIASKLDAWTVAACISNSYAKSFIAPTIKSGFVRCGIWDP